MSHDHCVRLTYSLIVAVIGKDTTSKSIKSYIYASSHRHTYMQRSSSSHPTSLDCLM